MMTPLNGHLDLHKLIAVLHKSPQRHTRIKVLMSLSDVDYGTMTGSPPQSSPRPVKQRLCSGSVDDLTVLTMKLDHQQLLYHPYSWHTLRCG
eukprot:4989878-Amphidinium_carterae.3